MSEESSVRPVLPEFSLLRESYHRLFRHMLNYEGLNLGPPERMEQTIAQNQLWMFAPLIGVDNEQRKAWAKIGDSLDEAIDPIADLKTVLADYEPTLSGCHYRSVGLDTVRSSVYAGSEHYWKNFNTFSQTENVKTSKCSNLPGLGGDFVNNTAWHFSRLLEMYFKLFGRSSTINEKVFLSRRPRGPLGLELQLVSKGDQSVDQTSIALGMNYNDCEALNSVLTELLKEPSFRNYLVKEDCTEPFNLEIEVVNDLKESWLLFGSSGEASEAQQACKNYFAEKLPHVEFDNLSIARLIQGYMLYARFAGPNVYTFPTPAYGDRPSCGWSLSSQKPIPNNILNYLQRLSELVYVEVIGQTISRRYQTTFHMTMKDFREDIRGVLQDRDADIHLTANLAGTPIPLAAVNTILGVASQLPLLSTIERSEHSFMLVLVPQEFVSTSLGANTHDQTSTKVNIREIVCPDLHSIQYFSHGMRINAAVSDLPDHYHTFVYPPFDDVLASDKYMREKGYTDSTDVGIKIVKAKAERSALAHLDPAKVKSIWEMTRVKEVRRDFEPYFFSSEFNQVGNCAEILTYSNPDILVLTCEGTRRITIYHNGKILIKSSFLKWQTSSDSDSSFAGTLNNKLDTFFKAYSYTEEVLKQFQRSFRDFVYHLSRHRRGALFIFHDLKKPDSWRDLDTHASEAKDPAEMQTAFKNYIGSDKSVDKVNREKKLEKPARTFFESLSNAIKHDGAVVFHRGEDESVKVGARFRVIPISSDDSSTKRIQALLMMKVIIAKKSQPYVRSMGTKHNTALEYVLDSPEDSKRFAISVSSDGPITIFAAKKSNKVDLKKKYPEYEKCWDKDGILEHWTTDVMMIRV